MITVKVYYYEKIVQFSAVALLSISAIACSCNKEETTTPGTNNTNNNNNNNNTTQQGKGAMTLVCNGQTFVNAGNCNYSSSADCIVVADSNASQNAFTLNLNGGLPGETTTYPIVEGSPASGEVSMSFVRFPSGNMYDWESANVGGSVTLTVNGNKITCTINDIPMDGSDVYNPDALKDTGTCSGSFTLYK